MIATSVASNRKRLSQRSCQKGKELTLAPAWLHSTLSRLLFTLAIPSEVPSTQLIADLSNPYLGHHFSMVILTIGKWSFQSSHNQGTPDYFLSNKDYSYIKYPRATILTVF
jgi:hypothetical protein